MEWEAKGSNVFEGGKCIAICDTDNASHESYVANAKLMASAPALLGHLKFVLRGIDRGKIDDASILKPYPPGAEQADVIPLSQMIREVIAKAEA